jgi:disulfide bond formation protein DsbB
MAASKTRNIIVIVIVLAILIGAGVGIYFLVKHIHNSKNPSTINNTNGNANNETNQ